MKNNIENTLQEDNLCTEKRETLIKQQEPQSKEERAINIIVRALRKYVFRKKSLGMISKLKQLIKTKRDEEIEKSFSSPSHVQTMCGVCGIHYVTSSEGSNDNTIIYERQENRLKDTNLSHSCERLNDLESTVKTLSDSQLDSCSTDTIDRSFFPTTDTKEYSYVENCLFSVLVPAWVCTVLFAVQKDSD